MKAKSTKKRLESKSMEKDKKREKEILEDLLDRCYRLLSYRPRTEREIKDYLYRKFRKRKLEKMDKDAFLRLLKEVVERLKNEKLINDKEFIKWWVEQRSSFKPRGKFVLKRELFEKGVSGELIDRYFEENKLDEYTLAKKVLQKKKGQIENLSSKKRFKKGMGYLLRRGFPYSVAKKTFEDLLDKR